MAQERKRFAARPLAAACLSTSLLGIDPQLHVLAVPGSVLAFGTDESASAVLRSVATFVLAFSMFGTGWICRRIGLRTALILGAGLLTAASITAANAGSTASLMGARVGAGAGTALLFAAGLAVIATSYRGRELTFACSVWLLCDALAVFAAGPLGGLTVDVAGWRGSYVLCAATTMVAGLAGFLFLEPDTRTAASRNLRSLVELMRHRGFIAAGLAGLAFNFSNGFALAAYPILGTAVGLPSTTIGLVTAVIGAGSVAGALGAGFARGRMAAAARPMYLIGLTGLAVAAILQLFTGPETAVVIPLAGCLLTGAAIMWIQQPQSEVMITIAGVERAPAVAPLKTSLGQLGMAAGLAAAGPAMNLFNSEGPIAAYGCGSALAATPPLVTAFIVLALLRSLRSGM